jgi:hypothetical protein
MMFTKNTTIIHFLLQSEARQKTLSNIKFEVFFKRGCLVVVESWKNMSKILD